MKLFTVQQIRDWDAYTIQHEPVPSIDLMERAARACVDHLLKKYSLETAFAFFCGRGNNGGDGLAIARLLAAYGYRISVHIAGQPAKASADFLENLDRLEKAGTCPIGEMDPSASGRPALPPGTVVIDALLGSGVSKPLAGELAAIAGHINESGREVVSIDIPSGLPADRKQWNAREYRQVVNAHTTLTFQVPKTSFLFPDTGRYCGDVVVLDIGLHPEFARLQPSKREYLDPGFVNGLLRPRSKFDHKGVFGHALLVAGSAGKNGAAVLAARACLRSGAGLLTVGAPRHSCPILQTAVPEAMTEPDDSADFPVFGFDASKYTAVGIGPGIGTGAATREGFKRFLPAVRCPLVIDADGLNLAAGLLRDEPGFRIPRGAVLTPHVGEFGRLAEASLAGTSMEGVTGDSLERFRLQLEFAAKHEVFVLLKGAHSCLATPEGRCYFNSTGNPFMAKGGSGDVLTGMITALLAQGYSARNASLLGMYFHGKAGDKAASRRAGTSVIASDIIEEIAIAAS